MKKIKLFAFFLSLGFLSVMFISCGEDEEPLESCAQDEFCSIPVTSCCSEDGCVWKYDGKEYTADQETELAGELGCSTSSSRTAAGEKQEIILKLRALMNKAKAGL